MVVVVVAVLSYSLYCGKLQTYVAMQPWLWLQKLQKLWLCGHNCWWLNAFLETTGVIFNYRGLICLWLYLSSMVVRVLWFTIRFECNLAGNHVMKVFELCGTWMNSCVSSSPIWITQLSNLKLFFFNFYFGFTSHIL